MIHLRSILELPAPVAIAGDSVVSVLLTRLQVVIPEFKSQCLAVILRAQLRELSLQVMDFVPVGRGFIHFTLQRILWTSYLIRTNF
jgi:hypothetical protein